MSENEIIEGIKSGNSDAIDYAMKKYSRLLWGVASQVLKKQGTAEDVEECVADAFIYLWQHPQEYDQSRGKLKSWLVVIARNKAIDKYRRIMKLKKCSDDDAMIASYDDSLEEILQKERYREVFSYVVHLEEPGREIVIRRYYYDQKPKQIATALGMSVKQVDNYLFRSKAKLRKEMTK